MRQLPKRFDGTIVPDMGPAVRPATAVTMPCLLRWVGGSVDPSGRWVPLPESSEVAVFSATTRIWGHVADVEYQRYFLFVYDGTLSRNMIYCYDGALRTVLDSNDIDEGLSFGLDAVPRATLMGRYLIWTDGVSDPKVVDVESAMVTYDNTYTAADGQAVYPYTPPIVAADDLYVMRRTSRYAPLAAKVDSSAAPDGPYAANVIELHHLQFSVRYLYVDGAISVLSPYSNVVPPNIDGETLDAVLINLPFQETIPSRVKEVLWLVREGIDKPWYEFARSDEAAIAAHNSGTAILEAWYGKRRLGLPVGDSDSARLWDSVPIRANACVAAGGRLLFGGTIEQRYADADEPALTVTPNTVTGTAPVNGTWLLVTASCTDDYNQEVFIEIVGSGDPNIDGYYWTSEPPSSFVAGTLPSTYTLSNTDKTPATTQSELIDLISPCGASYDPVNSNVQSDGAVTVYGLTGLNSNMRVWKGGSTYGVGIAFFDRHGRTDGVYAVNDVSVPVMPYVADTATITIDWSLPSGYATSQIPTWADTYAICVTRNKDALLFVECYTDNIQYGTMNDDGTWSFSATYSASADGIAIDISGLLRAGIGYTYTQGDYLVLATSLGLTWTLRLHSQWGNYVVTELKNLGDLFSLTARVELITPRPTAEDVFYEATSRYAIARDGGAAAFTVTGGSLTGDVVLIDRGDPVLVEAMSANDTVWDQWHPSLGKVSVRAPDTPPPHTLGRVRWSDAWHPYGPATFCTFYELNFADADPAAGSIQAMRSLDRAATGGTVLVAICEERVCTAYLRVHELVDQQGESTLVRTNTFLAQLNMLATEAGTTYPESVVQIDNYILFVDARRGEVMRYSIGGVTSVSRLSGWSTITNGWLARIRDYETSRGIRPWVPAGIDRGTSEYVLSMPEYGVRYRASKFGYDHKTLSYLSGATLDTSLLVPQGTTTIALLGLDVGALHELKLTSSTPMTVTVRLDGRVIYEGSGLTYYLVPFMAVLPNHTLEVDVVENVMGSYEVYQVPLDRHEADYVFDRSLVWSNVYERLTTSWPIAWDYWAGGLSFSLAIYYGRLVRFDEGASAVSPTLMGYSCRGWLSFLLPYSPVPIKLYGMTIDGMGVAYIHIKSGDHYDQATDMDETQIEVYGGKLRVPVFKDMLSSSDIYDARFRGETLFGRAPSVLIELEDQREQNYIESVYVNVTLDKGHIETI